MYQGNAKRVLTVCSAGLLRSPTAAWLLSNDPWNFNTRSCGYNDEYALVLLDEVLLEWADEVVVMDQKQESVVNNMMKNMNSNRGFEFSKPVHVLNVPDNYSFRDPQLVELMLDKFHRLFPAS